MTFPRALAWHARGAVKNMTLHLGGHAAFADLEHAGRKSGIVRHTPVRAFRAGDTVIIGSRLLPAASRAEVKKAGRRRCRLPSL